MTSDPYFVDEEEAQKFEDEMRECPAPDFFMDSMMAPVEAAEDLTQAGESAPPPPPRGVKGEKQYSDSFKVKYKTEMCKNWTQTGQCEFMNSCSFAHGKDQLKQKTDVPKNYKTKLCKKFHKDLFCPYGARCQFVHDESLLTSSGSQQALSQKIKEIRVVKPKAQRKRVQDEVAAVEPLFSEVSRALKVPVKRLQIFATITEE